MSEHDGQSDQLAKRKLMVLTVREYARRHGITIQTTYRRIWQGQIQARRMYGRWLISTRTADPN